MSKISTNIQYEKIKHTFDVDSIGIDGNGGVIVNELGITKYLLERFNVSQQGAFQMLRGARIHLKIVFANGGDPVEVNNPVASNGWPEPVEITGITAAPDGNPMITFGDKDIALTANAVKQLQEFLNLHFTD